MSDASAAGLARGDLPHNEASQGNPQVHLEGQSLSAFLPGLEVSNTSLCDGASAAAVRTIIDEPTDLVRSVAAQSGAVNRPDEVQAARQRQLSWSVAP